MFRSFVQAGFDCTHGWNRFRARIDSTIATGHAAHIDDDYRFLRQLGIASVRDGAPWSAVELKPRRYYWDRLDRVTEASQSAGIQVIYDFCHFGYPDHLDIFAPVFVEAFSEYCYEAASRLRRQVGSQLMITPLNEPSYWAWAAGHVAHFPPYVVGRAFELKQRLVAAMLAGIDAIWRAVPDATIVNVDPICRAVAPEGRPDLAEVVERFNTGAVLEAWDMLAGKLHPELGGHPKYLGVMGLNYYWTNQWELGSEDVPLAENDHRRWPLHRLLKFVWKRYGADIVVTETGHMGHMRGPWVREVAAELRALAASLVPVKGVCFYPISGMPAWHAPDQWLSMGLWDFDALGNRSVCTDMQAELSCLVDETRLTE